MPENLGTFDDPGTSHIALLVHHCLNGDGPGNVSSLSFWRIHWRSSMDHPEGLTADGIGISSVCGNFPRAGLPRGISHRLLRCCHRSTRHDS
jgi:hypothetical protein